MSQFPVLSMRSYNHTTTVSLSNGTISPLNGKLETVANVHDALERTLAEIERQLPENMKKAVRKARQASYDGAQNVADMPYKGNKDCNLSHYLTPIDYPENFKKFEQEIISSVKYLETFEWENVGDCFGNLELVKMVASRVPDDEGFIKMISNYGMIINTPMYNGNTLLHFASKNGYVPYVDILIRFGAHINVKDSDGLTPLHWATREVNLGVVERLIKGKRTIDKTGTHFAGVHTNQKDHHGLTALHWAAQWEFRTTADESSLDCTKEKLLRIAASLIKHRANIDQQDDQGFTALHWAAMRNFPELAELLINNGATLILKDNKGHTPFDHANRHDDRTTVTLITEKLATLAANSNHRDPQSVTARPPVVVSKPSHQQPMSSGASRTAPWSAPRLFSSSITNVFSSLAADIKQLFA